MKIIDQGLAVGHAVLIEALQGFPKVPPEETEKREKLCGDCTECQKDENGVPYKCTKCGCFLYWKIRFQNQKCPLGKW